MVEVLAVTLQVAGRGGLRRHRGLRMPGLGLGRIRLRRKRLRRHRRLRMPGTGLRTGLGMPGTRLRTGLGVPGTRLRTGLRMPGTGLRRRLRMGSGLRIDGLGRIGHRRVRVVVYRPLSGVTPRKVLAGAVMVLRSARALRAVSRHTGSLDFVKKGLDFPDLVVERNSGRGESRARIAGKGQNRYHRRQVNFFHSGISSPRVAFTALWLV